MSIEEELKKNRNVQIAAAAVQAAQQEAIRRQLAAANELAETRLAEERAAREKEESRRDAIVKANRTLADLHEFLELCRNRSASEDPSSFAKLEWLLERGAAAQGVLEDLGTIKEAKIILSAAREAVAALCLADSKTPLQVLRSHLRQAEEFACALAKLLERCSLASQLTGETKISLTQIKSAESAALRNCEQIPIEGARLARVLDVIAGLSFMSPGRPISFAPQVSEIATHEAPVLQTLVQLPSGLDFDSIKASGETRIESEREALLGERERRAGLLVQAQELIVSVGYSPTKLFQAMKLVRELKSPTSEGYVFVDLEGYDKAVRWLGSDFLAKALFLAVAWAVFFPLGPFLWAVSSGGNARRIALGLAGAFVVLIVIDTVQKRSNQEPSDRSAVATSTAGIAETPSASRGAQEESARAADQGQPSGEVRPQMAALQQRDDNIPVPNAAQTAEAAAVGQVSSKASFDCAKAATLVEQTICTDPVLGRLDSALSENYKFMLASDIGDGARSELKATQKRWIVERNSCTDSQCLTEAYRKRVDAVCEYPVLSGVHPICVSADSIK